MDKRQSGIPSEIESEKRPYLEGHPSHGVLGFHSVDQLPDQFQLAQLEASLYGKFKEDFLRTTIALKIWRDAGSTLERMRDAIQSNEAELREERERNKRVMDACRVSSGNGRPANLPSFEGWDSKDVHEVDGVPYVTFDAFTKAAFGLADLDAREPWVKGWLWHYTEECFRWTGALDLRPVTLEEVTQRYESMRQDGLRLDDADVMLPKARLWRIEATGKPDLEEISEKN
ncbi:hypothetical protein [Sulfuriroseicoccus oceanibius]|uniref:Uncharacterized protein n=1 Tax=Sulfuriroseicoccus oceanibius TaxID=2707525 RepID=A0A6B3LD25_9BACT|nr:hypothetical protein [Sulfuriroseicoccus oceanibius]QQL44842.1 hypothetical protein G3M56_013335 [Sulfuriroseicoccus oceanibius]